MTLEGPAGGRADHLADHHAIVDVLHRYALGIDTDDAVLTASCFTEDARYELGEEVVVGRPALIDLFADRTGVRPRATGLDRVDQFTHAVSNIMVDIDIDIDGPRAGVTSMILATVAGERNGSPVMLVRNIGYTDRLVRLDGAWRIAWRRHVLQWMFETVPTMVRHR
ncbi:MAG TPA: nuclear transport factor 2 family protein [Acidimicrobiales bacterium]|nr:nuclear transport factor 2 family protein [Acidimicrobiales bacterium]